MSPDRETEEEMEWSIQQIARTAGTTSRTLRHYDDIGLLPPSRVASNGYRYYDSAALVRLQRILLLRQLGLGLDEIARILDAERDESAALRHHLAWLADERDRITRQMTAVEHTLDALKRKESPVAEDMFDGFDHTVHRDEVEERWGKDAYARGDAWWRSMSDDERKDWGELAARLAEDWKDAATRGIEPASDEAQALASRHADWLRGIPGTPAASGGDLAGYLRGLGEMYVADPRFAANYGGGEGAEFVRDALAIYAEGL